MKIRDGSPSLFEHAHWQEKSRDQVADEQFDPWTPFEDEASLEEEEDEELFDEPLLQQLYQSWLGRAADSHSPGCARNCPADRSREWSGSAATDRMVEGNFVPEPAPQPAYQRAVRNWPPHNLPVQSRPMPSRPMQSQPVQNQPVQSRPVQSRPTQTSSAPSQPAATPRPAQTPAEAPKPAATQPATQPQTTRPQSAPSKSTLNLPPRPQGSMTGKQFIESTRGMDRKQREAAILSEIQKGNVPDFARQMREIQVNSNGHTGTLRVMPDYLAIGSNDDFVRIPMDAKTAQKIADQTGTSLPTTKMVDDIYKQADTKLTPQPLPAGAQMMSNDYYERHNNLVEQQMGQRGAQHGQLTAGHQKDVVISNRLTQHPDRVAIYGWHQQNGKPIQGLSTVHESTYADYSHGVRLVGGTMIVDGQERPVSEVLRDPALAGLISNEGVIRDPRVPGV